MCYIIFQISLLTQHTIFHVEDRVAQSRITTPPRKIIIPFKDQL